MERRFYDVIELQKKLLEMSDESINEIKDEISQSSFIKTKRKLNVVLSFLHIILEIRPNYHNYVIELIHALSEPIKSFFDSEELISIFQNNFTIVLILLEMKIISIESIFNKAIQSTHYFLFFQYQLLDYSPEFVKDYWQKCQRNLRHFNIPNFLIFNPLKKEEEKQESREMHHQFCMRGRNEEKITEVIRNDDIEQFQSLISMNNIKFESKINHSIYESIDFINNRNNLPSLIEYSAFFCSQKIFKFLFLQIENLPPNLPYYAIAGGNYEIIHLLESRHILYDSVWISTAIEHHQNEIFEYIKNNLSNEDVYKFITSESCLLPSIINYNLEIFLNYVDSFDVNETNDVDHWNPLLCAVASNHLDIVKFLYKKYHVNLNVKTTMKNDALLIASSKGYLDIVKFLLRTKKIDVNSQNDIGESALHIAAKKSFLNIIMYLVKKDNIDINIRDTILFYIFSYVRDETPLISASRHGNLKVVRFLLTLQNIDISIKNNEGIFTFCFL
ncbi:hypothetical protein M9Y10_032545 [Tritrichomonas musculus]|uniref:DUF3447 domain-containing protein n=1 Tax=Tritrichomonas musculus TaxID=1915356 RepID=A0ABR2H0M9_9EUKA